MCLKSSFFVLTLAVAGIGPAYASANDDIIASAESAAPRSVTANATIKALDGSVIREGSNSYTCYPQQDMMGPMYNRPPWDALIDAMLNKQPFEPKQLSISYMLAGEGTAIGVSNSDPYAADPKSNHAWVKEGPT